MHGAVFVHLKAFIKAFIFPFRHRCKISSFCLSATTSCVSSWGLAPGLPTVGELGFCSLLHPIIHLTHSSAAAAQFTVKPGENAQNKGVIVELKRVSSVGQALEMALALGKFQQGDFSRWLN